MPKARDPRGGDPRVVWSSDDGDLRADRADRGDRGVPDSQSADRPGLAGSPGAPGPRAAGGRVEVRRETAGRRGKAVTTVRGLPLDDEELRAMAGRLKRRCGVGGSAKGGVVELQGDHRSAVVEELRAAGYHVVRAGG